MKKINLILSTSVWKESDAYSSQREKFVIGIDPYLSSPSSGTITIYKMAHQYSQKKEKINQFKILIDDIQNIFTPSPNYISVTIHTSSEDFSLLYKAMEDILSTTPSFPENCPSIRIEHDKRLDNGNS